MQTKFNFPLTPTDPGFPPPPPDLHLTLMSGGKVIAQYLANWPEAFRAADTATNQIVIVSERNGFAAGKWLATFNKGYGWHITPKVRKHFENKNYQIA
jgi:hypothetical protein